MNHQSTYPISEHGEERIDHEWAPTTRTRRGATLFDVKAIIDHRLETQVTGAPTGLTCGIPDCDENLYLEWELNRPLYADDLVPGALPEPDDAYVATWRVVCANAHCLLVPGQFGCPLCGDDDSQCPHDDYDGSEDHRTFRAHDATRLRDVLAALGRLT